NSRRGESGRHRCPCRRSAALNEKSLRCCDTKSGLGTPSGIDQVGCSFSVMPEGIGTIGRYLIVLGIAIVAIGILFVVAGKFPGLRIGRLPGDIYIQRDGWRFYFPLMTSIILSIILSLVLWLINRSR